MHNTNTYMREYKKSSMFLVVAHMRLRPEKPNDWKAWLDLVRGRCNIWLRVCFFIAEGTDMFMSIIAIFEENATTPLVHTIGTWTVVRGY